MNDAIVFVFPRLFHVYGLAETSISLRISPKKFHFWEIFGLEDCGRVDEKRTELEFSVQTVELPQINPSSVLILQLAAFCCYH